jgi:hypothetical protein
MNLDVSVMNEMMERPRPSPEEEWLLARRRVLRTSKLALFYALIAGAIAGAVSDGLQGAGEFAAAFILLTLIPIGVVYAMAYDRLSPNGRVRRDPESRPLTCASVRLCTLRMAVASGRLRR